MWFKTKALAQNPSSNSSSGHCFRLILLGPIKVKLLSQLKYPTSDLCFTSRTLQEINLLVKASQPMLPCHLSSTQTTMNSNLFLPTVTLTTLQQPHSKLTMGSLCTICFGEFLKINFRREMSSFVTQFLFNPPTTRLWLFWPVGTFYRLISQLHWLSLLESALFLEAWSLG